MRPVFAAAVLTSVAAVMGGIAVPAVVAPQSRSQWDGIYSEAQARRGAAIYGRDCRACHGATLLGAEGGPSLIGADFDSTWSGRTIGELFEKIRSTMPQSAPGSLTEREYADVLAYVLSAGRFPAGTTELPAQPGLLNLLQYQAKKP